MPTSAPISKDFVARWAERQNWLTPAFEQARQKMVKATVPRRIQVLHALLNVAAAGLFVWSAYRDGRPEAVSRPLGRSAWLCACLNVGASVDVRTQDWCGSE